jgi:glycosyltransferase involved in cell wall biosynthesis
LSTFILAANENWICDRFATEWINHNPSLVTDDITESDTIWLLAGWRWRLIPSNILSSKRVIATIHHIVPNKFNQELKNDFNDRDQYIDLYHVPCQKTKTQLKSLTNKPIWVQPFWVNPNLWFEMPQSEKIEIRKQLQLNKSHFLIGSFQRDTEGYDLISPKLEKGPDLFCDAVEQLRDYHSKFGKEVRVLLAGWRRQYVMKRLDDIKVKYYYFELPSFDVINKFYNALDLYIVAARYEGGPQAVVECAATKCPIISTDVGLAADILNKSSIFEPGSAPSSSPDVNYAHEKIQEFLAPAGFMNFTEMFSKTITED